MLATNRLNQSRPRPADAFAGLVPDGSLPGRGRVGGGGPASAAPAAGEALLGGGACSIGCLRRRHENSGTGGVLVFRRRLQFLPSDGQYERLVLVSRREVQQRPIHRNATSTPPQEAAEVDDGDPHPALRVRQEVYHSPEILPLGAVHVPAENGGERTVDAAHLGVDD